MSRTILAVVAIVAIAAMMGAATVAPTYAAPSEKANNDKDGTFFDDVDSTASGVDGKLAQKGICGFPDDLRIHWTQIETTTGTIWNNGHFKINISSEKTYYAPTSGDVHASEVIGVQTVNQNEQGWFVDEDGDPLPEDEPLIFHENEKTKCFDGAKVGTTHSGITEIYRNGDVVHRNIHHN